MPPNPPTSPEPEQKPPLATAARRFWHQLRGSAKRRGNRRLLLYAALGVAGFVLLFYLLRILPTEAFVAELREWGILPFFIGFTLLPLIGFPTTPFYLVAGATFGTLASFLYASVGLALQLSLAYWLARKFLCGWIEWLIRRGGYTIPEVKPAHYVRMALIVKLAPGPPAFIKSYLLGLAKIPFSIYIVVSWTTSVAYALSFILLGESLIDGDIGQGLLGLLILALTATAVLLLRKRFTRK